MMKSASFADPDDYVASLDGWRRTCVEELRAVARGESALQEVVKWGHLVYLSNGPVALVRAEETRVLFGFWRGKRLRELESRLKPGGKYEMATLELHEGEGIKPSMARRLLREAVRLNKDLGDPTAVAKKAKG